MRNLIRRLHRGEAGVITAEWSTVLMAVVGLGIALAVVLRSSAVQDRLSSMVVSAFSGDR